MRPFPRGPGPLVSVLFPTRGRPQGLCEAVDSLYSLAHDKSLIEFIFKADDDDQVTIQTIGRIGQLGVPAAAIISPRGRGYHDMHLWVNEMAKVARGDWLIIWNDDALMKTNAWEQQLLNIDLRGLVWHGCTDVCAMAINTVNHPGSTGFFFLRRKVVEILGRFSTIPHNDTWAATLMRAVDSIFHLNSIQIEHKSDSGDATWNEGDAARKTMTYTTLNHAGRVTKMEDALKLARYIEEYSRANS